MQKKARSLDRAFCIPEPPSDIPPRLIQAQFLATAGLPAGKAGHTANADEDRHGTEQAGNSAINRGRGQAHGIAHHGPQPGAFASLACRHGAIDETEDVGLAGTGSKKLLVKEVFVPEYRSHVIGAYDDDSHGHVNNLYKMPFFYVFYAAVSSVLIGMARGMVDLYIEHMVPRQNINQAVGAAVQDPFIKAKLGEAYAKILASTSRVLQNTEEAWSYASRGKLVPLDIRIRHFATNQFTGGECFDAGHMIFKKTSTRGVWLNCPMQRQMRDLLVGANHITQNQDNIGDLLGGHLLGNPLPSYPAANAEQGVCLYPCVTRLAEQPLLAGLKHLNRLEQVLARGEWQDPAFVEGLMRDQSGRVIEGVYSNLFLLKDDVLATADLSRCGVAGVMRAEVLEQAMRLGISCEVRDIGYDELLGADEVFLCNSLYGIWPVRELAASVWPAGPLTRKLQALIRSLLDS